MSEEKQGHVWDIVTEGNVTTHEMGGHFTRETWVTRVKPFAILGIEIWPANSSEEAADIARGLYESYADSPKLGEGAKIVLHDNPRA